MLGYWQQTSKRTSETRELQLLIDGCVRAKYGKSVGSQSFLLVLVSNIILKLHYIENRNKNIALVEKTLHAWNIIHREENDGNVLYYHVSVFCFSFV